MPHDFNSDDAKYERAQDRADAKWEEASEARDNSIESCNEHHPGFVWRWRIVESARVKLPSLRVTDPKKAMSLARRIKHLEKFCEDAIKEDMDACADAASEAADQYAYHGVRRSDF